MNNNNILIINIIIIITILLFLLETHLEPGICRRLPRRHQHHRVGQGNREGGSIYSSLPVRETLQNTSSENPTKNSQELMSSWFSGGTGR